MENEAIENTARASGTHGRSRTGDLALRRRSLYPLSYVGVVRDTLVARCVAGRVHFISVCRESFRGRPRTHQSRALMPRASSASSTVRIRLARLDSENGLTMSWMPGSRRL